MTQEEWKNIFGDNLSTVLREKRMTQSQLAKESGVSMGMISDYVNKRSVPGIFAAINIAYALDMDLNELIDYGDRVR